MNTQSMNREVRTAPQTERIERIKAYHSSVLRSFSDQMGYAFLAGAELNALKDSLEHGQFLKWREKHLPEIPHRTASRYMRFSQGLVEHFPAVGKLATVANLKLIGPGGLEGREREEVLEAVHDAADGKTLTEFYRDLGVIRPPKKPQHHPVKPMDPEANHRARRRWPTFLAGLALGGLCASVLWFSFWRWGDEHWQALAVKAGYGYWYFDDRDMPRFKWGEKLEP